MARLIAMGERAGLPLTVVKSDAERQRGQAPAAFPANQPALS
jgi:hypothetical protein